MHSKICIDSSIELVLIVSLLHMPDSVLHILFKSETLLGKCI